MLKAQEGMKEKHFPLNGQGKNLHSNSEIRFAMGSWQMDWFFSPTNLEGWSFETIISNIAI